MRRSSDFPGRRTCAAPALRTTLFDFTDPNAASAWHATDWQTFHLPLADFRASFRGREVTDATPMAPARIRQVGLMIASRQAGPFALDIRRISLT